MRPLLSRGPVKEALECLHDNLRLAQTPLAGLLPTVTRRASVEERSEFLRSLLLEGIEALKPRRQPDGGRRPAAGPSFGSPQSRSYDVLTLRYLEGLPLPGMEIELSLGRRQIYRDLEEAEAKLAGVLESWADDTPVQTVEGPADSLSDELAAKWDYPSRFELRRLLREAIELVTPLSTASGVGISFSTIGEADFVLSDRAFMKVVLVQLLCFAVQEQ